jgi:glycosyltransferase involved in cell wall biosynthesis
MSSEREGQPPIAVLTVSRRSSTLARCVASVDRQTYRGPIRHILVIDDNRDAIQVLKSIESPWPREVVLVARSAEDSDGPARLARLRNDAVSRAADDYVAFIDDDNEWEPNHLASLHAALVASNADIVHSERQVFEADGRPYLRQEFPWARDLHTRHAIYAYCVAAGIMSAGSNVVRDRLEMRFTWIDLGEWLFPPQFLVGHPFETGYGPWEWFNISVEDRSLPKAIYESGMRVASTEAATLRYYLGGYTNTFEGDGVIWRNPAGHDETAWTAGV